MTGADRVAECDRRQCLFRAWTATIHTPTPDCFLDGITRRTVIDLAKRRGIDVVERAIMPEELAKADEIFLTGTAAEVTPIGMIDDLTFTPGQICKTLIADYDAAVHGPDHSGALAGRAAA